MGFNFCNETERQNLIKLFGTKRDLDIKPLYTYLCPVIIFICFFSIIFNAILMSISRQSKLVNKSPILLLSLNLALTDLVTSLLNGLNILFNSYLPEVYDIKMGQCSMLMFEVVRCAALVASALHLLALAFVHYRGIVNPLHYRSTIFFSQHLSRTINIISTACWIIPFSIMIAWFSSSPCQGFQSAECDYLFLLGFKFRYMVLILFALPLLIMSGIYVRIFIIISRHQNSRRMNHEQSTLTRGVIDTVGSIGTATVVNLPELLAKTDAVRCAACAAQALRDDDDPTVSILSGELSREATKGKRDLACDVVSSAQDGIVIPGGTSCAAAHRLEWNIIDQDRVVRTDYKGPKSSISNWSQTSSVSPTSVALDQQQNSTTNSSSRKTYEKDQNENLFTTYLSDAIDVEHHLMSPNGNKNIKRCILFDDSESVISQRRSLKGERNYSPESKAEYNDNCDQVNGKKQPLMDDNKVIVQDNNLSSTFEQPYSGLINPIHPSRIKSELQPSEEDTDETHKLISQLSSFNDIGSGQPNDSNAQGEESNLVSVEQGRIRNGSASLTKTVSLLDSQTYTNTEGGFVTSASLKARKTSSSKTNKNEKSRAPLEGQYSLGTTTSGPFNDSCSNKEPNLLSLPDKSKLRLVSKQQARFKLQKAEKHCYSFEQREERKKQQNASVKMETMPPSSLSTMVRNGSPSRDCTCGNKLGQFNAKLSRSNTIGDHSNNVSLNYKSNTSRTIVTMSGSQRSSISSAFTPSSIRSKLRRSPTSGSLGTNIQADYRSGNNARHYNSTATNITASSSIYEPQRRHIHASAVPQTNTKALITTLLILGTYFISYVPAIIYQVLTCVDHCPYPLYTLSFSRRVFFGAMTTLLLIAKSIIDPFIYSYRMSEIQLAINRYLSKRKSKSSMAASMQTSQRLTNASCLNNNNPHSFHHQANQFDQTDLNDSKVKHPISSSKILNGNDSDRIKPTLPSTVLKLRSQPIKEQPVPFERSDSKRDHINTDHKSIGFACSKQDPSARGMIKPIKDPLYTQLIRNSQETKRMLADSECEEEIENEANTGVCLNNDGSPS